MTSLDKKKSTEKEIVLEINQHKIDECYSLLVFPQKSQGLPATLRLIFKRYLSLLLRLKRQRQKRLFIHPEKIQI